MNIKKYFNRKNLSILGAILVLVAFGIFYKSMPQNSTKNEVINTKKLHGEVLLSEGKLEIRKQKEYVVIQSGQIINEGDEIRINGVGRAVVEIDDGSAVRLNDNSSVVFEKLNPDEIVVKNIGGEVYTRIIKSDSRKFFVTTDELSAESLGTAYKTTKTDKEISVSVYQSKVKIKESNLENEVNEGNKYTLNKENREKIVKEISKEEIKNDKFAVWCKEQDQTNEKYKNDLGYLTKIDEVEQAVPAPTTPVPNTPVTTPSSKITLTGSQTATGIYLGWTVQNTSTTNGFKILKGTKTDPTYETGVYQWVDGGFRNYEKALTGGGTYYFRVCQYTGSGCGVYSNSVAITLPPKISACGGQAPLSSISINGTSTDKKGYFMTTGCSADGYKVIWSKTPGVNYPKRPSGDSAQYINTVTDQNKYIFTLDAFDGAGTYYLKACQYLNGTCGVSSPEIIITL